MLLEAYRQSIGSILNILLRSNPPPVDSLPTELLEIIFDDILAIPFLLDGDCDPVDFYFFAIAHRAWDATGAERRSYGEKWKTLRAVCRRWKAIVDRHSRTWVRIRSSTAVWNIPPEARRVDVLLPSPVGSSVDIITVSPQIDEVESHNIQVLSLSESHQSTLFGTAQSNLAELNRVLGVAAQWTRSIHSVIYEGDVKLGPVHLEALNSVFPLITSLTLHVKEISGTLSLPNLKVLWISAGTFDISRWDLPSLRHLALGDQHTTERTIHYDSLKLGSIKNQFLSLLKFYPYHLNLDPLFWADHPSLEFLGAPCLLLDPDDTTTDSHNARIFCITGPEIDNTDGRIDGFSLHIPQFPHLKTFITPNKQLHTPEGPNAAKFLAMLKYCAENDITWYIGYGERAREPAKREHFANIFG
ncbi:hypothetical protein FRC17_010968 [Serendipita sp. 399]|nr:hypothetical protein FRC17_010968 [Serendipita sp. 399]